MSDLDNYIADRKLRDREFAKDYDDGFTRFAESNPPFCNKSPTPPLSVIGTNAVRD